jgi:hypothetical protein
MDDLRERGSASLGRLLAVAQQSSKEGGPAHLVRVCSHHAIARESSSATVATDTQPAVRLAEENHRGRGRGLAGATVC